MEILSCLKALSQLTIHEGKLVNFPKSGMAASRCAALGVVIANRGGGGEGRGEGI